MLLVGRQNGSHSKKRVGWFLTKINTCLSYNPATALLGIYLSQRNENLCSHENLYMNVHSSFSRNGQKLTMTQCPSMGEWLNKLWYLRTMKQSLAIKRSKSLITCSNVDGFQGNYAEF